MAKRYHVSPETWDVKVCTAKPGNCWYSQEDTVHGNTPEETRQKWEKKVQHAGMNLPSALKKVSPPKTRPSRDNKPKAVPVHTNELNKKPMDKTTTARDRRLISNDFNDSKSDYARLLKQAIESEDNNVSKSLAPLLEANNRLRAVRDQAADSNAFDKDRILAMDMEVYRSNVNTKAMQVRTQGKSYDETNNSKPRFWESTTRKVGKDVNRIQNIHKLEMRNQALNKAIDDVPDNIDPDKKNEIMRKAYEELVYPKVPLAYLIT